MQKVIIDTEKLHQELRKRKKTGKELSQELGRDAGYISHLNRAPSQPLSVEHQICWSLGLEPGTLIWKEEPKIEPEKKQEPPVTAEDMIKLTKLMQHGINDVIKQITKLHDDVGEIKDSVGVIRKSVNTNKVQLECVKKSMQDMSATYANHADRLLNTLDGAVISKEPTNITEAKQLLSDMVQERGCDENAIYEEAQKRKIRKKDVQRAKGELAIIVRQQGYGVNAKKIWIYG